jgi:Tfp pilus assembly protein PilF
MKKATTQSGKGTGKLKSARQTKDGGVSASASLRQPGPATAGAATSAGMRQEEQTALFDKAAGYFRRGDFAQAKGLFEKAASGPLREVAHAARLHVRMCEQRISQFVPQLSSAEDHYNYAIALINRRELPTAEKHLQEAVRLAPDRDHIHYALALARGLRGDVTLARESLKRAIELEPRNRAHARNDPDFAEFAHLPPIVSLLFPESR